MITSLFRSARGLVGIWSELRRLNRNIEHLFLHHSFFEDIGLPPSLNDIKRAEKEKYETVEYDEEKLAGERAVELAKRRAKGEDLSDEPGSDWSPV